MTLSRLRWVFLASLVALFALVELARFRLQPELDTLTGQVLLDLAVLGGALFFFGLVFRRLRTVFLRLERSDRDLPRPPSESLSLPRTHSCLSAATRPTQAGATSSSRFSAKAGNHFEEEHR